MVRFSRFSAIITTAMFACLLSVTWAEDPPFQSLTFEPATQNSVFTSAAGKWDAKIRERGWILKDDTGWRLWYTGYNPDQQPLTMSLGMATSTDGITWTRSSDKPIINDFWIEDMMIVRQAGNYYMFAEGAQDQAQLLRSTDGTHWERIGTLDIRLTDGQPISAGPFGTPTAWFENGIWNLFYERRDAGIWLARSNDMKIWTDVSDDPVIVPGPDSYDSLMIAMNQVIRIGDQYVAVLHGTGSPEKPRQWCTYLATSPDLIHWKKDSRGPLRPVAENKSSGQLVNDAGQWRLYTMHDKVDVHLPQLKPRD